MVDQRKELYISLEKEIELIHRLGAELIAGGYNASNSYIITVSTDYSSIVGQILRHQLSYEGEICDGFGVDVPYPDEQWDEKYQQELIDTFEISWKDNLKARVFSDKQDNAYRKIKGKEVRSQFALYDYYKAKLES